MAEAQPTTTREDQNGSDMVANSKQLMPYNKPARNKALLEIRRLLVDHGYSHSQIMAELNIPPTTYWRWINILFEAEQEAITGNNYTYQRLLSETLLLQERYLAVARKLQMIGDDKDVPAERRIEAYMQASNLIRSTHDIAYFAPSYLARQGLIPVSPNGKEENLSFTRIHREYVNQDRDEYEHQRLQAASEYRQKKMITTTEQKTSQQPETNE